MAALLLIMLGFTVFYLRITRGLEILAGALRARPGDAMPAGAAYWNQPATSRMALIEPTLL